MTTLPPSPHPDRAAIARAKATTTVDVEHHAGAVILRIPYDRSQAPTVSIDREEYHDGRLVARYQAAFAPPAELLRPLLAWAQARAENPADVEASK